MSQSSAIQSGDRQPPPLPSLEASADDTSKKATTDIWRKLPQLLRWIGGLSLLGSAASFLSGDWMNAEPLMRYYSFFALTSILSIIGIFCGVRMKEDKSARTFLSLSTAFIPVLFCQLGALVFAEITGSTSQFSEYFQLLQFDPIGVSLLVGTVGVGIASFSLYAFLGFSAMARSEAKRLTLVFIISNTILLLPFREANIVAIIGFGMLAGLV